MILFNKKFLWMIFFINQQLAIGNDKLFIIMDNPATAQKDIEMLISGGYQVQTGNSKNSNLIIKTILTFYSSNLAYSFCGNATNNHSYNRESSETYQIGTRIRYNLTKSDYLFTQASWLIDKYNGFNSKDIFTIGYGRQIFDDYIHSLKIEIGPNIRHEYFINSDCEITKLSYGYISENYEWKINNSTKFKQSIIFLTRFNSDSSAISEMILQISANRCLSLNLISNINWNSNYLLLPLKQIDTKTSIQLNYTF